MIRYQLATETDDAELRALLRNNGMQSWVELSLEREPSFFAGMNKVTEDFAMIARDDARTVGMYSYSLQPVYVNGLACSLGYLGGMRVSPPYRNRIKVVRDGFVSLAKLTPPGDYPFWFSSVATENAAARRLLEAGLPGMPRYYPLGDMTTLALPIAQARNLKLWRNASATDIPEMIAFHQAEAAKLQLSPQLNEAWIRTIGLENFLIYRDNGIQACVAVWDQSAFKQIVARSYRPLLHVARPFYNGYAALTGRIGLPAIGQPLRQCYLAFAAFSATAMAQVVPLLRDALRRCLSLDAAVIGLHDQHPLLSELKVLKPLIYRTRLYAVSYADLPMLDGRSVQPEVALL
jgi:hypothetical protein